MKSTFADKVQQFGDMTPELVDQIRRASCLDLFSRVIVSTPVDTGRLRANWQTVVGRPADGLIDSRDKSGAGSTARILNNLGTIQDTVWFCNNLPYAERIEYEGWSAQAPAGMMRRHVAEWGKIVLKQARNLTKK